MTGLRNKYRNIMHPLKLNSPYKAMLICALLLYFLDQLGAFTHIFEKNYFDSFTWPLEVDGPALLRDIRANRTVKYPVISTYGKYRYRIRNGDLCNGNMTLIMLIKSALPNSDKRDAIRRCWGRIPRFSDVPQKRIFLVGLGDDDANAKIDLEHERYGDIVQGDFIDYYHNNTIKTMLGFRWLVEHCLHTKFALFIDDDYYLSVKNLLQYARNPFGFLPGEDNDDDRWKYYDGRLFTGFVLAHASPMRHKIAKWYLTLDEYPFSKFPPYVTAGAYILNSPAIHDVYHMSKYTKDFRFDDVYLGIVAKKAGILQLHTERIRFWEKAYDREAYRTVVAAHGFSDHEYMCKVWNEQYNDGFA